MKVLLYAALFFLPTLATTSQAQTDSLPDRKLTFSGYAEIFYGLDLNADKFNNAVTPHFLYNFNRHNEVNLNLGYFKAAYATSKIRANLAIMAGTYARANTLQEMEGFR